MHNMPALLSSIPEALNFRKNISSNHIVGFVPTMGALHEGHAALLRKLRSRCDSLILSIFVNPTQFGPNEDFSKYPRTFEKDMAIATRENVDAVFFPHAHEIYPEGYSTFVIEENLSIPFCGKFRPGHFKGVTTIVLKLLNITQPHIAYFGLKDVQQFFILHKMTNDLNLSVSIEGVATVREKDGLALSSRNAYLLAHEREKAPLLYKLLCEVKKGALDIENAKKTLEQNSFNVQYLERQKLGEADVLATAAYLGSTRLIDNIILNQQDLTQKGFKLWS